MALQAFNVPTFTMANAANPTEQELNRWTGELNTVTVALDNIIQFFGLQTPIIPMAGNVAAGADQAARLAHVNTLGVYRTQVILFQGTVMAEA